MPKTNIVIIEDHPLFARGLTVLVESEALYSVAGTAANVRDGLKLVEDTGPDLAIVDLNLNGEDGLDFIKQVHARHPELVIFVLSMLDELYYAQRALKAGARGYIMKEEADKDVLQAIKTVLSGKIWLSCAESVRIAENSLDGKGTDEDVSGLTDRQLQIFSMIGEGLGTVEISARLNVSKKTVDAHKEAMKVRLHCTTSQELRQKAVEWYAVKNRK